MTAYTNKRGESVMTHSTFRALNPEAIMRSLLPAKLHIPTRARKEANGTGQYKTAKES